MGELMQSKRCILIAGASSDIGLALIKQLSGCDWLIGAHCFTGEDRLRSFIETLDYLPDQYEIFSGDLSSQASCHRLVDACASWAGGSINALVQLTGNVSQVCEWECLEEVAWQSDLAVNLSAPFFLAQRAFGYMKNAGGRILLMSTASASHGGGAQTFAYGIAKAGVECMAKGLAKVGAPSGILVNALAPGLIETRFHMDRLGRTSEMIKRRADMVPLKRAGRPEDVARMAEFLLSSGGDYITGEVIAISGGDWL